MPGSCQDIALFKNDAYGRPLYLKTDFPTEGSPYFIDEYYLANITAANGNVYSNVKVKVNLLDHFVQYLSEDGKEMITDMPVKKIEFKNIPDENGVISNVLLTSYPGVLNSPGAAVYQMLDSGKVCLLKKITISFRDDKKYNEASTTRIFERREVYFSLAPGGQAKKIEKGKAAMLELFSDDKDKIALFIDQHNLNCRSEASIKEIFKFYNGTNQ